MNQRRQGQQAQSTHWYRVAELRPALGEHAQFHRHSPRGEVLYVLEDPTSERSHHFTPAIYEVLQFFDGEHTLTEIHDLAGELLRDDAPSQEELIEALAQLHSADALTTEVEPDTDMFLERMAKMKRARRIGQLADPLSDPERVTVRGLRYLRPLFSVWGLILWVAFISVVLWVPIPLNSMAEGVVWLPEESLVRAKVAGWVAEELVASDAYLVKGQPVLRLEDSILEARLAVTQAEEEELLARVQSHRPTNIVAMEVVREELETTQERLAQLKREEEQLVVRTLIDGAFQFTPGPEQQGRFVERGEVLGTVMGRDNWQVLVLIHQDEIDLIRSRSGRVEVRFGDELERIYEAVVVRETPTASKRLPSGAFSTEGGGEVSLDPTDSSGLQAFDRWFRIELAVPHKDGRVRVGGRVHVRFCHGREPLGKRWYRTIRRSFIKELDL